jgi:hypothetical protein
MVNLIKNATSVGIYITIDNASKITGNTPGDLDLDQLTLGTNYVYLADFQSELVVKDATKSEKFAGWVFGAKGAAALTQKTLGYTGEAVQGTIVITAVVDDTTDQNLQKLFDTANDKDSAQYFLLHQFASETFRQFSYAQTLKKFAYVCLVGYTSTTTNTTGKFMYTVQLTMKVDLLL